MWQGRPRGRIGSATCALAALAVLATQAAGAQPALVQPAHPYASQTRIPEPVVFMPGVISTGDDDSHPTFTADGRTLYFLKNTPRFDHWTVLITRFEDGAWSTPVVAPFSGQYGDGDVFFTSDGEAMYFVSTRPREPGGAEKEDTDVWTMKREGDDWSEPRRVDELSSEGNEWYPTMTTSGVIYFGSERRKGNRGPEGTSDLWRSRLIQGRFTRPENLGALINTPGNDIEPYISPDETFMIFASNGHPDTRGSYDLYVTYQCHGQWSKPRNLGDAINSVGWDFSPRVSPDGRYLFFTSNRGFSDVPLSRPLTYEELIEKLRSPGNGLRDIYQVDLSALNLEPGC